MYLNNLAPEYIPSQLKQKKVVLSKGGTLDVGRHTGITMPNTSLEVVKGILEFFILDDELVDLIMIEVKLYCIQWFVECERNVSEG